MLRTESEPSFIVLWYNAVVYYKVTLKRISWDELRANVMQVNQYAVMFTQLQ